MIIAFDIDDTLADLVPVWLRRYNKDYNDHLGLEDMTQWDISSLVKPECGKKIYQYLVPDLYDNIKPRAGAREMVEAAREVGHVIFVTSANPLHMGRKFQWLQENGFGDIPVADYIECSDKGLILADVLFDDRPENLHSFTGKHRFLIERPWNRTTDTKGFTVIGDLSQLDWHSFFNSPIFDKEPGTTVADLKNKAVKYDVGKPQMELLSPWVLMEVAKVMTHGAQKYAPHNWRKGFQWTRPIGAALRHIAKWLMGEDLDPEWDLPHLAHAICCLMFTLEHQLLGMGVDDRWKKEE